MNRVEWASYTRLEQAASPGILVPVHVTRLLALSDLYSFLPVIEISLQAPKASPSYLAKDLHRSAKCLLIVQSTLLPVLAAPSPA